MSRGGNLRLSLACLVAMVIVQSSISLVFVFSLSPYFTSNLFVCSSCLLVHLLVCLLVLPVVPDPI